MRLFVVGLFIAAVCIAATQAAQLQQGRTVYVPVARVPDAATATPTATTSPTTAATIGPSPTATPMLPPPSFISCGTAPANPGSAPNYPIAITNIDKIGETVTLQNRSTAAIDLANWRMCSIVGGQDHPINGQLATGESRTFVNTGGNIWNNTSSDPGALYNPEGQLVSYWPD
jgi:hypothetical protein